jgi:hypothetical protein
MAIVVTCFQGYIPIYETYKIGDTGAHQHHRLDQVYQEISFLLGFLMVKHKYFTLDFLKRNHEKKQQ